MTLEETLAKVQQACHNNPPNNETATRERVFNRLLQAISYEAEDWQTETRDEAGKRPDYILLHGTEYEWYLEAKAWQVELTPKEVSQAVSYPNHTGKRWAVLSNGRVWKLYDNHRQASLGGKLVISVSLDDNEGIVRLLTALSPESVKSGGLELFEKHETERLAELEKAHKAQERQGLLAKIILQQIGLTDSPLILAMANTLHEEAGLESITPEDVVSFFQPTEKEVVQEKVLLIPSQIKNLQCKPTNEFEKLDRIKLWASRPNQENYRIIVTFLELEKFGGVTRNKLENQCTEKFGMKGFGGKFSQLKTDAGNSYGKVFYEESGFIRIWPLVRNEIEKYF